MFVFKYLKYLTKFKVEFETKCSTHSKKHLSATENILGARQIFQCIVSSPLTTCNVRLVNSFNYQWSYLETPNETKNKIQMV